MGSGFVKGLSLANCACITSHGVLRMPHGILCCATGLLATFMIAGENANQQPSGEIRPGMAVEVAQTFDGRPFFYTIVNVETKEHCRIIRVRLPSPVNSPLPQNNTIPAEVYIPLSGGSAPAKRPAVICLHILDGSLELPRMLASVLAANGVAGLVFPMAYFGERGSDNGPRDILSDPQRFSAVLEQIFLDIRRLVDFLASRPEIDPEKIGVAGISLGAVVAASSAEREPRLHRVAMILGGGDLFEIIKTAREAAPIREFLTQLPPQDRATLEATIRDADPLTKAEALRERALQGRVLMINATADEVIPRKCTQQLADALGIGNSVIWLENLGHYTTIAALPSVLQETAAFFAQDLDPSLRASTVAKKQSTVLDLVVGAVQKLAKFYLELPGVNHCHIMQVRARLDGKEYKLVFARGQENQFRVEAEIADFGKVAAGQGQCPWLVAKTGQVFVGEPESPLQTKSPLEYVNPTLLERARFAVLAINGIASAPAALEALIEVTEIKSQAAQDGERTVVVKAADKSSPFAVRMTFPKDSDFPATIEVFGLPQQVQVFVDVMELNTPVPKPLFDWPSGTPVKTVSRNDLYRMLGAVINFAAEKIH